MIARSNTGSSNGRRLQGFKTKVTDLDADMSPRDICESLDRLTFFCGERHMIRIDTDVRNYLLAALRREI